MCFMDPEHLDLFFNLDMSERFIPPCIPIHRISNVTLADAISITLARAALKLNCRCSGQIALEVWRRDVEAIPMPPRADYWKLRIHGDGVAERKDEVKKKLLELLKNLVK